MSVLYYCYCGYTQREPAGRGAPYCREVVHLGEPRADYPTMTSVVVIPSEHLAVVRAALGAYRDEQHRRGDHAAAASAAAALDTLPTQPSR